MRFVKIAILARNKVSEKSAIHIFHPFTSLGPSHCNVACLEINGTVRFLLRTVRAKVIYASRQKSERHFETRSIKRVLRLGKRRTNLTGVPWDDRDNVGVFWELA